MELCITGYGVVSALGVGRQTWETALAQGPKACADQAFGRASEIAPPARIAEVWDWEPKAHLGPKGHRSFDRLTKFLITAAKGALEDAGIKKDGSFLSESLNGDRVGVCSATAYGSLDAITELNRVAELEDPRYINPQRFPNTVINAAAGYVSIWEGLRAPNTTVVDGNCGALDAVLVAATHLDHDRADAMLVGGGEVASEPLVLALARLGLVDARDGQTPQETLSIGEGAAFFVAENAAAAAERGQPVLATIAGYGTAFDPPMSEALLVHCSAEAAEAAVRFALADAGLSASDVGLVISGAAGIESFNRAEREGIMRAGVDAPSIAPKSFIGETFGASGAFAMATALAGFESDDSPPPVLIVTMGFYGNASAVILRKN